MTISPESAAPDFRGIVRSRDPETSWLAAAAQTPSRQERVKLVLLLLLAAGPLTDEQLVDRYEGFVAAHPEHGPAVTPQSVRTRRRALQTEGRVAALSQYGVTRGGHRAQIWAVRE